MSPFSVSVPGEILDLLLKQSSLFPPRLHTNLTKGFGIMGPKEFFPLLDFAFMPKNALSPRCVP